MRRVACNSCAPTPQAGLRREKHMPLSRRSIILALGSMPLLTRGVSSRTTAADGRRLLRLLQQNLGIPRVQFIEKGEASPEFNSSKKETTKSGASPEFNWASSEFNSSKTETTKSGASPEFNSSKKEIAKCVQYYPLRSK